MVVSELIAKLEKLPADAWVDIMLDGDDAAYAVSDVDLVTISGDRRIVIIEGINGWNAPGNPGAAA